MPPKVKTAREFLRSVSSGLRTSAVKPNIWGYKPHEKQIIFHSSNAKGRALFGGNRSGKTVGGATDCVMDAIGKNPYRQTKPPPLSIRAVAVDFIEGIEKIVKPEIARWSPPSELRGNSWSTAWDGPNRTLYYENGSFIEFMSYEQDLEKFAGVSRDKVWFDEEPPHDIFIENRMRLLDVGGDWVMTMTPVEGMTWVYDEVWLASKTDPNIGAWVVDMYDNPHLNRGELEAFLTGLTADEREARIHGKFVQIGGLIYKMLNPELHFINPVMPPKDWLHFAGMDHGFNNPTAWLWGAVDKDGRIVIYDEHYENGQIVAYHAEKVHQVNRNHEFEPSYNVGDPSIRNIDPITGTSVLLEYMEHGVPIVLGNNDVKAGINRVARHLTPMQTENGPKAKLYITKNCVNLIYEIQRLRWSTWASKKMNFDKNKKEEQHKKNDHACDALRYMVSSRPEVDTGTEIPSAGNFIGAPVAISPYERIDEGVKRIGKSANLDYTLGSEW